MVMKNKIKNFILGILMILSINVVAQETFWYDDFTCKLVEIDEGANPNSNGGVNVLAEQFTSNNGTWTVERPTTNGAFGNVWYINSVEGGTSIGECSMGWNPIIMNRNNTLHLGKSLNTTGDNGAFFSNTESTETDISVISPEISLSGKKNISLHFSYLLGEFDSLTNFIVSYYNGTEWVELPPLNNTKSINCSFPRNYMWTASSLYKLPSSVDNIGNFKLCFRFKSSVNMTNPNTDNFSVAIDDIKLNGFSIYEEKGNTPEYSMIKQSNDAPVVKDDIKKITFTVFPNPNSGQFTVDFSGVENNHEVQILLFDSQNGRQLYSTSYFSNSIDHNRVDITPEIKIQPGRYVCTLVCEGIRLNSTVIIH